MDGKLRKGKDSEPVFKKAVYQRGIPDYDYQIGNLKFIRAVKKEEEKGKENLEESRFEAFSGAGQSLRQAKNVK